MPAVRLGEEGERARDARRGGGVAPGIAGADRVVETGDLIFAGLDDEPQQRQRFGERAQLVKRHRRFAARRVGEIGAERIIPLPALDVRRGLRR